MADCMEHSRCLISASLTVSTATFIHFPSLFITLFLTYSLSRSPCCEDDYCCWDNYSYPTILCIGIMIWFGFNNCHDVKHTISQTTLLSSITPLHSELKIIPCTDILYVLHPTHPSHTTQNGSTALILSAEKGYAEIVKILMNKFADIDAATEVRTISHWSSTYCLLDKWRKLLLIKCMTQSVTHSLTLLVTQWVSNSDCQCQYWW